MLPLDGVLVVAIEQAISAPYCTRTLADLGARVIKVESAGGDFARHYDDVVHGTGAHFAWVNRGKESIVLDLKSAEGRDAAEALLDRADVLIQNLAPSAAARLGLDARSACGRHPRLVAVDISGYGEGGPRSTGRAYDLLVQAETGSCTITGTPEHPAKPGIPVADIGTGVTAANAILAALFARAASGHGAAISIAMFDVVTDWMGWAYHQARFTGEDPKPNGVSSPTVSPYGAYPTSDGQTVVIGTTNDAEWRRLAEQVIGRTELAENPRYAANLDRLEHRGELDDLIAAWAVERTFDEITALVDAAKLGYARLNRPSDVLDHPQLVERDRWVETGSPGGNFPSLRPAADVAEWDWTARPVPSVGEHTAAILAELGL